MKEGSVGDREESMHRGLGTVDIGDSIPWSHSRVNPTVLANFGQVP